jgi:hypothetical protein
MKKIIYLLAFVAVLFTSCDPLDDVYTELDAQDNPIVGEAKFTLTDEDYDELGLNFGNFSSIDDAKDMLPAFLSDKFPVWGEGSLAEVTYDLFARKSDERSLIRYTVTSDDYDDLGHSFGNFDRDSELFEFLEFKYPDPADRLLVSLTYDFFDGSVNELNNGFLYLDGEWIFVQGFTEDEYSVMGESFPNFSNEDEADAKIPIALLDKFKFDGYENGDIVPIMYKLFVTDVDDIDGDGRTDDRTTYSFVKYFIFNGSSWSVYTNVIQETLQFGHDGTTWVPDNTIRYTITSADVAFISNAFIAIYPGPADNVGFFGSFDRRPSSSNYWSDDMLLEAFNALLDNLNPSAEEGQKYALTYVIFNGSTGDETMNVIKSGGAWIYNN